MSQQVSSFGVPKAQRVAFFLPAFHRDRFNDSFWKKGFTEWDLLTASQSKFPGHIAANVPEHIEKYDLSRIEYFEDVARHANDFDIETFAMYHYRSGNFKMLRKPFELILKNDHLNFPFFLVWANEDWKRNWDGRSGETLLYQRYDEDTFNGLVDDLVRAIRNPNYFRLNGQPVFLIYRLREVPEYEVFLERLRLKVTRLTGEELIVGNVFNHEAELLSGSEFAVQFPPHKTPRMSSRRFTEVYSDSGASTFLESYEHVIEDSLWALKNYDWLVPGVCPSWDNTARRPSGGHVLTESSLTKFFSWVESAEKLLGLRRDSNPSIPNDLIFINAWNEWGEGAALEAYSSPKSRD
jgi:hypothetical protein